MRIIGITEGTDPAFKQNWVEIALKKEAMGVVLVTKDVLGCTEALRRAESLDLKVVLHATCTGWADSKMEPGSPHPLQQLTAAAALTTARVVADCIVRIDPIIPTPEGAERAEAVLSAAKRLGLRKFRISLLHLYEHRRKEVVAALGNKAERQHLLAAYGKDCRPSRAYAEAIARRLDRHAEGAEFAACATPELERAYIAHTGCIDTDTLVTLGVPSAEAEGVKRNPQKRKGCGCLAFKDELFPRCKKRCPHGCAYCYWRD